MGNKSLTLNCSEEKYDKVKFIELNDGLMIEMEVLAVDDYNAVSLSDEDGFKLYKFLKGRYSYD